MIKNSTYKFLQLQPLSLPLIILFFEYAIMVYSGVGYDGLFNPVLFTFGADPFYWSVFILQLQKVIFQNPITIHLLTYLPFILLLACVIHSRTRLLPFFLLIYFVVYYIILTSVIGHHNFQLGIFLCLVPLTFKRENQHEAVKWIKYWVLFFYLSAAFLKLTNESIFQFDHFSKVLEGQFIPYRLEHSGDLRLIINNWMINHVWFAQMFYYFGIMIELSCILGLFTSKYDKLIGVGMILFHLGTWILMDIAPIGQISLLTYMFIQPTEK